MRGLQGETPDLSMVGAFETALLDCMLGNREIGYVGKYFDR